MTRQPIAFFSESTWIFEIFIGIILLISVNFMLKYLFKRFRRSSLTAQNQWKQKIGKIMYVPIKCILSIIGVVYVFNMISLRFGLSVGLLYLTPLCDAAIVVCLAWLLMRWKKEFLLRVKWVDAGVVQIISRLVSFAIIMLALLLVLQIFGLNVMPLIAFGGVGAAAVGFAAKDVLANFFGGLMLHVTRPFSLGDFIVLPDRKIEGHVEMIGWYFTSIRDREKRPVYLPNSFFSTFLVINSSRMSHRRILETIGIRYEDIDKAAAIIGEIKGYLSSHSFVDHNLPLIVSLESFQDYAVGIKLEFYCLTTRIDEFHDLKQQILLEVYAIIKRHQAEIPYPTSVYFQK